MCFLGNDGPRLSCGHNCLQQCVGRGGLENIYNCAQISANQSRPFCKKKTARANGRAGDKDCRAEGQMEARELCQCKPSS